MDEERIATVVPVDEAAAAGKVAEVFEDIKQTKSLDFVPLFWRVLATHPDHLEIVWSRLKVLMHPVVNHHWIRLREKSLLWPCRRPMDVLIASIRIPQRRKS